MAAMNLNSELAYLKTEFLHDAKVIDAERGYISISSFNLRMKPQVLKSAAILIANEFKDDHIDIVHGIPHSGNYLATAVAMELGESLPAGRQVRLHASRKDQNIPSSWKDVYRAEVQSFTTSSQSVTVFSGINLSFVQKGDRVLLIDDVCATGEAGYHIVNGLQKRGVKVVGFAVLFDKIFQGGLEYVSSLGIKVFSCVRVEKIGKGDSVTLK
jgi:adenine/guanine phosphoribosyltransferase-like PRPP-binding protein